MAMTDDELRAELNVLKQAEAAMGAPMFMGTPDRWYEKPRWRCGNDHVSRRYLKSEERGDLCLAGGCGRRVHLTFPEDGEGTLADALAALNAAFVRPPRVVTVRIRGGFDEVRSLLTSLPMGDHIAEPTTVDDVYRVATTDARFLRFAITNQGYGEVLD